MSRRQFFIILILYSLLIILPVTLAFLPNGTGAVFNGFLANPSDGYSYLAKMEQGRAGAWGYSLAFTVDETRPHFLFEYYIFLGHIAGWLSLPSIFVFHFFRWLNGMLMAVVLRWFIHDIWKGKTIHSDWIWAICLVGSGMGWLMIWTGYSPSDFWVAEAYPFLAAYTNPHFPLSISLILGGMLAWRREERKLYLLIPAVCGLLLAVIQPFGAVVLGGLIGFDWLIHLRKQGGDLSRIAGLVLYGAAALPIMILYQVDVANDPLLAAWNAQNVTPSAPWWDLLVSFSPGLFFAAVGAFLSFRARQVSYPVLWFWLIVGFGICFIPINLQRRFLIGIYIPLTLQAAEGIERIVSNWNLSWLKRIKAAYLALVIPTSILLLILAGFGILSQHPDYYFTKDEAGALTWLRSNGRAGDVILSNARMGLYLPAQTSLRVFYGHPFETPKARVNETEVTQCVQTWTVNACGGLFSRAKIHYVWADGGLFPEQSFLAEYSLQPIYTSASVVLYEVQ